MMIHDETCPKCGAVYNPVNGPHECAVEYPAGTYTQGGVDYRVSLVEVVKAPDLGQLAGEEAADRAAEREEDAKEEARDERTDKARRKHDKR